MKVGIVLVECQFTEGLRVVEIASERSATDSLSAVGLALIGNNQVDTRSGRIDLARRASDGRNLEGNRLVCSQRSRLLPDGLSEERRGAVVVGGRVFRGRIFHAWLRPLNRRSTTVTVVLDDHGSCERSGGCTQYQRYSRTKQSFIQSSYFHGLLLLLLRIRSG